MKRDLLRQLATFHAVGAEGGIVAAAKRIGKSPPAVHHDIQKLESRLGEKLFVKRGRGLRLTSTSALLHREIGRVLDLLQRNVDQFVSSSEGRRTLRIASVSGFARYRLAPAIFRASADLRIELMTGSHDDVVAALLAGEVDVAISYRPVVSVPIECTALTDERLVLIAAAGTPSLDPDISAVGKLRFVTYDEYEYVFAAWFDATFGKQPAQLPRSDHTTELEEAIESVAHERGVTIVPADAWLHGPWRHRCIAPMGKKDDVTNRLMLLSLPGQDEWSLNHLKSLLELASA